MAITWQRDPDTREHFYPFAYDDGLAMKVYRTGAGDYAITCHDESAGMGGEVEYRATLQRAKGLAERMAADGTWQTLRPAVDA